LKDAISLIAASNKRNRPNKQGMHSNHPKFNFQASWPHPTVVDTGKNLFYLKIPADSHYYY
jgi:hypothetical protein